MKSILKLMTIVFVVSIFSIFAPKNVFAADATLSFGGSSTVRQGENITLSFTVSNASNLSENITLSNIQVTYDTNQFEAIGNVEISSAIINNESSSIIGSFIFKAKNTALPGNYTFNLTFDIASPPLADTITASPLSTSVNITEKTTSVPNTSSTPSVSSTVLSNNADVLSIVCKEGAMTPAFNPLIKKGYIVNVAENITLATFTVTTAHNKALISIVGNKQLTIGDNKVTITITAEDRKTKNAYEINVIKGATTVSSSVSSMVSSTIVQSESKLANNLDKGLLSSLQGLKEENQKLKENNSAISEKFAVITILLVVLIAILIASLIFVVIKFREN